MAWRTVSGIHVVGLPDPIGIISEGAAREFLDLCRHGAGKGLVRDCIAELEEGVIEELMSEELVASDELQYEGAMPAPIQFPPLPSLSSWHLEMEKIPLRWRLDFVCAFSDLLDDC